MDIGEERETYTTEPVEDPFRRETTPQPERRETPAPVKVPEREKVPA
jgi:hypothetical protein